MGRASPLGGPAEQPCLWQTERECRLWRSSFPLVAVRVRLPTCRSYGGPAFGDEAPPPVLLRPTSISLLFLGGSLGGLPARPSLHLALCTRPPSPLRGRFC